MDADDEITAPEAARLLRLDRSSVYRLIQRGDVSARRIGPRAYLLSRKQVADLAALGERKPGRPRKPKED